jgi:hypothetical protein
MGPPPVPPRRRISTNDPRQDTRRTARLESRTRSEVLERIRREYTNDSRLSRFDREQTALSGASGASHSSIHIDSSSKLSIQADRSIKDPYKFKGDTSTFY